jgi:hypothetical protein
VSKPNEINGLIGEALLTVKLYAKRIEGRYLVSDSAGAKLELMQLLRAAMRDLVAIETQERCNEIDSTTR